MSSDANPQYAGQPGGPPPQYQQQPQYGPPAQYQQPNPYVEQGAPQGPPGQPPYVPPGGYVPVPQGPPPPGRGNTGKVALAAILSVVLVAAAAAVVLFKFVFVEGPDPAESFPSTASMYTEVNLDPSFDQTPKLLEHLSKFDDLDYDSTDDLLADLLEESGLENVDAEEDLTSWLGNRHGMAMWEHDGQPYAVASLASTDAGAAEDGMAKLRAAAGVEEDQLAYVVEDDHVLLVAGETGAADALTAAQSEAGDAPLSASSSYEDARSWLDGDQLVVYWVDMDAVAAMGESLGEDFAMPYLDLYSGQLIAGFSAFDEGFELNYRLFGSETEAWTGNEDLIADMGALPASDFAATAYIPENIGDLTEEGLGLYEDFYGVDEYATEESTGATEPVDPTPLTDAEYAEYLELQTGYFGGTLTAEEETRYNELDSRYWMYGTEDEPYDASDYSEEETDYGPDFAEIEESVGQLADLLAGSSLSAAGNFDAEQDVDPESLHLSGHLAEDRAQELQDLIDELAGGEALPEGVVVDGADITYTGSATSSDTLAEDARFADFAEAAPSESAIAVWVDLAAAAETYPDDFEGAEPLSAFAWAHGSVDGDGTGVLRLYLKD